MAEEAHKIVWFEAPADDTSRALAFYGDLFGWQFELMGGPMEYHLSNAAGGAIYPGNGQRGIVVYFGVVDVDESLARVKDLGGAPGEKQEIPGIGFYAVCSDSEGNSFGLYQGAA
jgi:uncharacterized protein